LGAAGDFVKIVYAHARVFKQARCHFGTAE